MEGVWAGGDITTGGATVISAMGAGKIAAMDMDEWLKSGGSWCQNLFRGRAESSESIDPS
jgi:hypothetical protein